MRWPVLLLVLVCGCSVGQPAAPPAPAQPTPAAKSLPVDISAEPPIDWRPIDVAGWRVFVPTTWEAHEFGEHGIMLWSPDGVRDGVRLTISSTPFDSLAKFRGPTQPLNATRKEQTCVVHNKTCSLVVYHAGDHDGVRRTGVSLAVCEGNVVEAMCSTPGESVPAICDRVIGSLRRVPKL